MSPAWEARADLVVVGSGVAGLTAALEAGRSGLRVLVVTKGAADDTNTRWAQGGVAVVLPGDHDPDDAVHRHITDTLAAGAGLCDEAAVATTITHGPVAVEALRRLGAVFDESVQGRLARTREGGHSAYRVIHAGGDATGAEIERALLAGVREAGAAGPTVLEHHVAVEVVRTEHGVQGLLVLGPDGVPGVLRSPAVLLATGGLGQLYRATSNPEVATGDGIALALRAGAEVADLEFVQFHPTVLYAGRETTGRRPLITEAVRGEGAVLIDGAGHRVMTGVHPLEDLAPRDVVSAAITRRMAEAPGGVDTNVFLDATHLSAQRFRERFPTVYAACADVGIDPSVEPIPVAPAAHFGCGGVVATTDGRTTVPGLYAAGEVARTGLHGANRLASNSLLEGLVTGTLAAESVVADRRTCRGPLPDVTLPTLRCADRPALQESMTRHAGIGRDADGLAEAVPAGTPALVTSRREVEDAALDVTARALIVAARERTESRGCHVRLDHPETDDEHWQRSIVVRLDPAGRPSPVGTLALQGVA